MIEQAAASATPQKAAAPAQAAAQKPAQNEPDTDNVKQIVEITGLSLSVEFKENGVTKDKKRYGSFAEFFTDIYNCLGYTKEDVKCSFIGSNEFLKMFGAPKAAEPKKN